MGRRLLPHERRGALIARDGALPGDAAGAVRGAANAAPWSGVYARRSGQQAFSAGGTSTHQLQLKVPFGGQWVDVALEYYTYNATPNVVDAVAVASGASFGVLNPLTPSAAASTWVVGAGFTVPAIGTDEPIYQAKQSEWMRVYIYPDAADPKWGTLFCRGRSTSGAVQLVGHATPAAYRDLAGLFDERMDGNALTNINDSMPGTPTATNSCLRSYNVLIRPTGFAATVAVFGDSRSAGQGASANTVQALRFGWTNRVVQALSDRVSVGLEQWAVAGTNTDAHLAAFNAVMATKKLDLVYWQPSSSNNTSPWTEATITANLATAAYVAERCEQAGVRFVTATMYPSVGATTDATIAQWRRLNDAIRDTYPHVVDFEQSNLTTINGSGIPVLNPSLAADTQHCNDDGHAYKATLAEPVFSTLLPYV